MRLPLFMNQYPLFLEHPAICEYIMVILVLFKRLGFPGHHLGDSTLIANYRLSSPFLFVGLPPMEICVYASLMSCSTRLGGYDIFSQEARTSSLNIMLSLTYKLVIGVFSSC